MNKFKMSKTEFLGIKIDSDSEIKEEYGHYSEEQLMDFLHHFVKGCKKVNKNKSIQIIAYAYEEENL